MVLGLLEFSEKIEIDHTFIPTLTHGADRRILLLLAFEAMEDILLSNAFISSNRPN